MPKDITKFLGNKSREDVTIEEFFRLVDKCKDKFELRKLEQALLKPSPLAPYKGGEIGRTAFKKKTLTLTFPNEKVIQRWMKFIRISQYKEYNTWDVEVFMLFLELLESGRLIYKREKKKLILKTKSGRKIHL